jgi:diaminopimelate decarboxylase
MPTYVLDEADLRQRCREYRTAFPEAEVAYAAKALLCRAVAGWVQEEGLALDVCSAGEIAVAEAARRVLEQPKLELVGVHCHLGSQVSRFQPYEQMVRRLVAFLALAAGRASRRPR